MQGIFVITRQRTLQYFPWSLNSLILSNRECVRDYFFIGQANVFDSQRRVRKNAHPLKIIC